MESIKNRRTIRKYKPIDIDQELLKNILLEASRASTTGNMQLYSVIITREQTMKEKLSPFHFNQPMVRNAPVILTFCADFNRFSEWCKLRNAVPGYNNFLSFMNAATDALLVAQNFCTLAEEEGLGICYLGTTIYNPQQIIEALDLPELVFPITTITVGYPEEIPPQVDRLPLNAILHTEKYTAYTADKIDDIYSYKESLVENKEFVKENNKESLAQVFTDIRYKKEDNENMSAGLLEVIKRQGFL